MVGTACLFEMVDRQLTETGAQRPVCPHCADTRTGSHGWFRRQDGSRERRYRCHGCGKTFNRCTNTPVHFIKKRSNWAKLADAMVNVLTVRQAAATLGITVTTAFRWRHRVLNALHNQPQPKLAGTVALAEAYVPFSEKGSRRCMHPRGGNLFARKPSCVLFANGGDQHAAAIVSSGRPHIDQLVATLSTLLHAGAEVWASGLGPYDHACRRMGLRRSPISEQRGMHRFWAVESLRRGLFGWLARFRGVATRYLENYLCWFGFSRRAKMLTRTVAAVQFFAEAKSPEPTAA